jgi:hypothetical protein
MNGKRKDFKFHNTRPVGKPRIKRKGVVRRETSQIQGRIGWRRQTDEREEWRRLVRGVRVLKGL